MARSHSRGPAALKFVRPASPEFDNFLTKVYARDNPKLAGGSDASLEDYQVQVRTLQKFFNEELKGNKEEARTLTIQDVTSSLLAGCMAWLKKQKGRKATTCNKLRRTIMAIHKFALEEKKIRGVPLRVKKFSEETSEPRAWRPEQIGKLLEAAQAVTGMIGPIPAGKWHFAHLMFLLNTGTRITASMETPTNMLDLGAGEVTVPAAVQKHKSDEVFDLLPQTVEALREINPSRNKRIFDDWPFDNRRRRKWRTLTKRLKRMLVAAGLFPSIKDIPPRLHLFHKFRKCFATFVAIKHGKQAATELCGHSHGDVTKRYLDRSQLGDRPSCRTSLAGKIQVPGRQLSLDLAFE